MSEGFWIQLAAYTLGGAASILVLRNKTTQEKGIGNQTRLALVVCLVGPIVLTLSLQKLLEPQAIAALIGALIGTVVPGKPD